MSGAVAGSAEERSRDGQRPEDASGQAETLPESAADPQQPDAQRQVEPSVWVLLLTEEMCHVLARI